MLRGTYKKSNKLVVAKTIRPSLQDQLQALKTQVNRNKPEIQWFRGDGTITSVSPTAVDLNTVNITSSIIASSDFRNNVIGDIWTNIALSMRFYVNPDCSHFRYVIYVPKKTGTIFAPTQHQFVRMPDPSAFWILADNTCTTDTATNFKGQRAFNKTVRLNRLKSIYNTSSSVLERGEIKVLIMTLGRTAGEQALDYSFNLTYSNK